MKREIIETKDGLKTINFPEINESYHSTNGALQEALHVFIKNGWEKLNSTSYKVLEIGFGTGLNAILTLIKSLEEKKTVKYTGLEAFPISQEEVTALEYYENDFIKSHKDEYFKLHEADWGKTVSITPLFTLHKLHQKLEDFQPQKSSFNLIYFDAFGFRVQPEMWSKQVFQKMYDCLEDGGLLTTYSSKGEVRRTLIELGFEVKKVPGPAGKREMLVARKT